MSSSTTKEESPNKYVTDIALYKVASDPNGLTKKIEPVFAYFTNEYMQAKRRDYLQASQAAGGGLSGEFGVDGCTVSTYSAYTVNHYPFSDYANPKYHQKRRWLLEDSGAAGKKAWLENKLLSRIDIHELVAAKVPTNKAAEQAFKDKENIVVVATRELKRVKQKPYFLHHSKYARYESDYVILPLEQTVKQTWSTNAEFDRSDLQNRLGMKKIAGVYPMFEILEAAGEKNSVSKVHRTKRYSGPYGKSVRHMAEDCGKWNCPVCYSLTKFEEPRHYNPFFAEW